MAGHEPQTAGWRESQAGGVELETTKMHNDSTSILAQLDAVLKGRLLDPANTIDDVRTAWLRIIEVKRRLAKLRPEHVEDFARRFVLELTEGAAA
jgi:hypothetical protein